MAKKEHKVEIIKEGHRWMAAEAAGVVTIHRDGSLIGKARWKDDQFLDCSAILPDAVSLELEAKLKVAIDSAYFD